jgi:hypothetical protein
MAQRVLGIWRKSFFSAKENLKLTPEQLKITQTREKTKRCRIRDYTTIEACSNQIKYKNEA